MEMDSQSRRGSRMGGWKRNSTGCLCRRGRKGEGGESQSQVCKARVEKGPQGQNDTGVRAYQVAIYESIIAATLYRYAKATRERGEMKVTTRGCN